MLGRLQRCNRFSGLFVSYQRWMGSSSRISDEDVCIVAFARTPLGAFQGSLESLSATQLGAAAIKGAVRRAGLSDRTEEIGEVFMGNVLSANLGQAPAKQAALEAGLSYSTPCTTVNKVCASGMKAIMLGTMSIQTGITDIVAVGGMESMSNTPYYLPKARGGMRMGDSICIDGMMKDGLWDPTNNFHMGNCGELCATGFNISREAQDQCAINSFLKAIKSMEHSKWERIPIEVQGKNTTTIDHDEGLDKFDEKKIRKLKPVFQKDGGTITAGNASQISDGAAALILARRSKAHELSLPILGRIVSMADAAQDPKWFTTSPALAFRRALERSGLEQSQIDFVEINEAFAVVDIVNEKLLDLDPSRVNVHGGAIALGHPIGCSGARILGTLINVLRVNEAEIGLATICNGGGGASAIIIARES